MKFMLSLYEIEASKNICSINIKVLHYLKYWIVARFSNEFRINVFSMKLESIEYYYYFLFVIEIFWN